MPFRELTPLGLLRPQVLDQIHAERPDLDPSGFICRDDLDRFRVQHVRRVLQEQIGEIAELDQAMIERLASHDLVSAPVDAEIDRTTTTGQRIADRVAAFGGSWTFIILFGVVLVAWMALNTVMLGMRAFDPFPYILLNLILSCLAAIQAPVIMMSQNRQEARDRRRAENDYLVNMKAELEIRLLHEKLDHLLHREWARLLEIQEIQIEMMRGRDRERDGTG
ncbi:MAG TPA: DUF1003 domain-containing protein [Geminicoccus sp.]|uniref:DUF1003 domain-containing protein n=1 Tax=Geminicoccus sp. TaxID=2024832 RepID=UPI002E36F76A|nr:DUF1003 domain-containing protein [Geminicoccus sp.]HEX2525101.1 DUF1003 domain-containing protein [Geminicoccus sp.]